MSFAVLLKSSLLFDAKSVVCMVLLYKSYSCPDQQLSDLVVSQKCSKRINVWVNKTQNTSHISEADVKGSKV